MCLRGMVGDRVYVERCMCINEIVLPLPTPSLHMFRSRESSHMWCGTCYYKSNVSHSIYHYCSIV